MKSEQVRNTIIELETEFNSAPSLSTIAEVTFLHQIADATEAKKQGWCKIWSHPCEQSSCHHFFLKEVE